MMMKKIAVLVILSFIALTAIFVGEYNFSVKETIRIMEVVLVETQMDQQAYFETFKDTRLEVGVENKTIKYSGEKCEHA